MSRKRQSLRDWLIRRLGGYTEGDLAFRDAKIRLLTAAQVTPRKYRAAYVYYVRQEDMGSRPETENARAALAEKLGRELMEDGMVEVRLSCDPGQDGQPVKRMRITGTVWAVKREERESWLRDYMGGY